MNPRVSLRVVGANKCMCRLVSFFSFPKTIGFGVLLMEMFVIQPAAALAFKAPCCAEITRASECQVDMDAL